MGKVDAMEEDEVRAVLGEEALARVWECNLMFENEFITGKDPMIDILDFVSPSPMTKDLHHLAFCVSNGYPQHCLFRFP